MSNFVVDVEADGPCPGLYSMVSFGAVLVDGKFNTTFYAEVKPISKNWQPDALKVSGFSREQTLDFSPASLKMKEFEEWILQNNRSGRPTFWSDNLAFDWQFINYYFHMSLYQNPFGYSGRRIGDYICGRYGNLRMRWKQWRVTKHDHNPVNDAIGNAEVLWNKVLN